MNRYKWIVLVAALGLIAGSAAILVQFKSNQRLGAPGVRHRPMTNSIVVELDLPARVGDFDSTNVPQPEIVTTMLPKDTSFAQRHYFAPDGFWASANVILMGADRTSIHKPDYCILGQGLQIVKREADHLTIRQGETQYDLPISKWTIRNKLKQADDQEVEVGGLYVFWFVTDGDQTPDYMQYMRRVAWHLLTTGKLQRWAYVSFFFQGCQPGQEEAAYERMKQLIAGSVPEFQLPPKTAAATP